MYYDFDMVVIGGGAAGLTAAGLSASLGAKTALVEARKLGGECTWTGCVPSKTLLKAAKVVHTMRMADRHGLDPSTPNINFAKVMEHVHATQAHIYLEADAPPIYESMGVQVITAQAKFLDPRRLEIVDEQGTRSQVSSRYFVIATGSAPHIPPLEGLSTTRYLTNETIFTLSDLPQRLIIIGAGPVGIEMAQAFRRLGSEVIVFDLEKSILSRDDRELTRQLQQSLVSEGIQFALARTVKKVERSGAGVQVTAGTEAASPALTVKGDALLLSSGRRANTDQLSLEAAGVAFNKTEILVDKHCRTSRKHIFACGDVTGRYQFTHMAEHMAKIAVSNALLRLPVSLDFKHVTWCTYTDPELSHVGGSEEELKRRGMQYEVYRFPFSKIDRAIIDNETTGMIKVLARSFTGKIHGVSILGANAGEMIGEYALAMRNGVTLRQIADTIHPYPTYALGNRRAADQWYVRKLSPTFVRWLQRIFGYRGQLPDIVDPAAATGSKGEKQYGSHR